MLQPTIELPLWHPRVIQWRNLFVFVDDGMIKPHEYDLPGHMVHAQALRYPTHGLGCVVILPEHAKPPPDATRKAIDALLDRLGRDLKCLTYVVEGRGFAAAACRGTLAGLAFLRRRAYPTHVEARLDVALGWVLSRVGQPSADVHQASAAIMRERERRAA